MDVRTVYAIGGWMTAAVLALCLWSARADVKRLNAQIETFRVAEQAAKAAAKRTEKLQDQVTTKAESQAVQTVEKIRTVTQTIVKEVPIYVTPQVDAVFRLPAGLVRLHDDAATGRPPGVPDASGFADGEASPFRASQLGAVIARNYGSCLADKARLGALQDWIVAVSEVQ